MMRLTILPHGIGSGWRPCDSSERRMLMRSSVENVLIQSQSGECASQIRCAAIRFWVAVCFTSVGVAGGKTDAHRGVGAAGSVVCAGGGGGGAVADRVVGSSAR